ncbi:ABC transporter substrate-binding protein [Erwinia sp. S63]|uniref:ABC transporter substrate-binding protein n=1 Tax=Erwinia sp. S63 TaxID=2769341 RepID=UPI001909AC0B|nr:ABC transporter substrate-binding protein [Erwinia sp. S63]MBK0097499.1 ABC transporter substrate-binding protein [Erwinia sp. S63]
MNRRSFLKTSIVGMAVFSVNRSFAADGKPIQITDERNVSVTLPAMPKRIASISYLAADVALTLGIMPVAVTYMTPGREPEFLLGLTKKMTSVGQRAKPNLELLSQVRPDVIVAMRRYTEAHAEQFAKIAPYIAYNMELLEESYHEVAQLTELFGQPQRGTELNNAFREEMKDILAKAPNGSHPRYQIMWAGDTPFSFHTENTAASIVSALGGNNIVGPMSKGGRFGEELSLETMLERDPEVIFVYDSGPDRPHENNPIWPMLSAVKNKRVFYVGDHWVESNGPIARSVVLREAAHYLYPNHFPKVDVKNEAGKFIPASIRSA